MLYTEANLEYIRILNAAILNCMRNCRDAGLTMAKAKPGSVKWCNAAEQQRMNFMYRVQLEERRNKIERQISGIVLTPEVKAMMTKELNGLKCSCT